MSYIRLPSDYTVEQFIADVKRLHPGDHVNESFLSDIAERMSRLSRRGDLLEIGTEYKPVNAVRARRYHVEPDNSLSLGIGEFLKSQPSEEVHSHGSWGVFCGYRGREMYTSWRRVDDKSKPGFAKLKQEEFFVLGPGDATYITDEPSDIHGHEPIDDAIWLLALFGRSVDTITRNYYTAEWRVREVTPGHHS